MPNLMILRNGLPELCQNGRGLGALRFGMLRIRPDGLLDPTAWMSFLTTRRKLLIEIAKESPNWDKKTEPEVWFMEMYEHTIKLWVVVWAENPFKSFALKYDILDNAVRRFKEEGIPLPRQRFETVSGSDDGKDKPKPPSRSRALGRSK